MRQCLTNPAGGYYINRDPFGSSGDFVTSPEISQMFGELVGIWFLTQWLAQGGPANFRLIEFGPGRGTLMDDFLRAGRNFSDFSKSIYEIIMIEASPTLREMQRKRLCDDSTPMIPNERGFMSKTRWGTPIYWYESARDIPTEDNVPTFIVAHEFFDALPIFQFEHTENGWRELLVDYSVPQMTPGTSKGSVTPSTTTSGDEPSFHLTLSPDWSPTSRVVPASHPRYADLPVGSRVEICPEAWEIAARFGEVIEKCGGAALIIDYGPAHTIPIESLRAIKGHRIVSPFEAPGEADLSADVDFQALKIAAQNDHTVDVHGPIMQGDWLHSIGIGARATQLAENQKTQEGKRRIEQAYNRLVEKGGGAMGKVYKIMSIVPQGATIPVGFGGEVPPDEDQQH
ncbi:hypothetical protein TRVA0_001S03422 [Trichomonascus vanleenenianus]|uniref:class I SAM-dependent methyltransferase n=1 Tax=Trichomonascus vanleenenianus TaxID=2268995 RepID=UPI003ECAF677